MWGLPRAKKAAHLLPTRRWALADAVGEPTVTAPARCEQRERLQAGPHVVTCLNARGCVHIPEGWGKVLSAPATGNRTFLHGFGRIRPIGGAEKAGVESIN